MATPGRHFVALILAPTHVIDAQQLEPAHATVWWNGLKVHDNVPIKHANGGIKVGPTPGGLKLQEHGQDVRFKNIWIVERKTKK